MIISHGLSNLLLLISLFCILLIDKCKIFFFSDLLRGKGEEDDVAELIEDGRGSKVSCTDLSKLKK